ncbi:MAG: helix-turn-helix transcriptional regulator [Clostridia bacterium]|nr:helix-turn-helix transcriptional regulator [Clostridia bacterium]
MSYRDRIKGLREDRDLTQAKVGEILNKSQQGYNHIEMGRAELKMDDLVLLCKLYDVSADYIIGLIDSPKSYKR